MSDATTHLALPFLAAAQAQKHVTHNEALLMLDAIVQLGVLDSTLGTPPASPAEGDRYIVAASATGVWSGHDEAVAAFSDGAWVFLAPQDGWLAYDAAAGRQLIYMTGAWGALPLPATGSFDELGVNATADSTNRLSVRSNAVLFTDISAADGGTGDVRFVVNKETAGDTASLLYQTGFSGRAEIGLVGDDDFVFKVSADGTTWHEAIRLASATGYATILYDHTASGLAATNVKAAIDEVSAVAAGKQAADSDLTALAGLSTTGLVARTGSGTATSRTLTAPAAGVSVSNGDGVSGNPTLALANDLAALEALGSTGLAARTAADTWAQRTITGTSNEVSVANGDGVSGNPTLSLPATVALRAKAVQVQDNNFTVADEGDATKLLAFQCSGIATATTRTLSAPNASGTIALLDVENQAVTGGGEVTSKDLGTQSSGTLTLDVADRPLQHYANNGAHTLAPGTPKGASMIDVTNGSSAGAVTTSGWTKVAGDAFDTTNGHKFRCHCSVGNGGSLLIVQALQ